MGHPNYYDYNSIIVPIGFIGTVNHIRYFTRDHQINIKSTRLVLLDFQMDNGWFIYTMTLTRTSLTKPQFIYIKY